MEVLILTADALVYDKASEFQPYVVCRIDQLVQQSTVKTGKAWWWDETLLFSEARLPAELCVEVWAFVCAC